jgi:hypothetical protein
MHLKKLNKNIKITLFVCVSSFISGGAFANDDGLAALMTANQPQKTDELVTDEVRSVFSDADIKKAMSVLDTVDWSHALPVRSLMMVKTKDGETLLASPDGRLLIKGGLIIDGWNKRQILTESDAKNSWKAHLSSFGVTTKDLPIYTYGKDKPEYDLMVFVDPINSSANEILFKQLKRLSATHKFGLILTPIAHGKTSGARGRELWCAKDQQLAIEYLINGESDKELETLENCDTSKIIKVIAITQFMQLDRLPYLIRSDGTHNAGVPAELSTFLTKI